MQNTASSDFDYAAPDETITIAEGSLERRGNTVVWEQRNGRHTPIGITNDYAALEARLAAFGIAAPAEVRAWCPTSAAT